MAESSSAQPVTTSQLPAGLDTESALESIKTTTGLSEFTYKISNLNSAQAVHFAKQFSPTEYEEFERCPFTAPYLPRSLRLDSEQYLGDAKYSTQDHVNPIIPIACQKLMGRKSASGEYFHYFPSVFIDIAGEAKPELGDYMLDVSQGEVMAPDLSGSHTSHLSIAVPDALTFLHTVDTIRKSGIKLDSIFLHAAIDNPNDAIRVADAINGLLADSTVVQGGPPTIQLDIKGTDSHDGAYQDDIVYGSWRIRETDRGEEQMCDFMSNLRVHPNEHSASPYQRKDAEEVNTMSGLGVADDSVWTVSLSDNAIRNVPKSSSGEHIWENSRIAKDLAKIACTVKSGYLVLDFDRATVNKKSFGASSQCLRKLICDSSGLSDDKIVMSHELDLPAA